MGFYAPSQLIQDARRHGVQVLPVDVQYRQWECTLVLSGQTARFLENLSVTLDKATETVEDGLYDMTVSGKFLDNDIITDRTISNLALTGGSPGRFNWFPGGIDPTGRNSGILTPIEVGNLTEILTVNSNGTFSAKITDIPKELGPKNFSITTRITTSEQVTPFTAAYTAIPRYGEGFFTGKAPASVFRFTSAELDETNPVKILFNGSVGGIVKGSLYNSELVQTNFDLVGLYSYNDDDFIREFADYETFGDLSGFDVEDLADVLRINSQGQFVLYIPDLALGDRYSFDVYYNVTWSNANGTYRSLNYVYRDIPAPGNPYGLINQSSIPSHLLAA
jgi:hypothetical protein